MKKLYLICLIILNVSSTFAEEKKSILRNRQELSPFLDKYCSNCHGPKKQKGKIRFDSLLNIEGPSAEYNLWSSVIEQLEMKEMPPEGKKQPSEKEKKAFIGQLRTKLDQVETNPAQTVLRRLTREEYINTLRDLFDMSTEDLRSLDAIPSDERHKGFTNNGQALVTSSVLIDKYLDVANDVVERVLPGIDKPERHKRVFHPMFSWYKNRGMGASYLYGGTNFQDMYSRDYLLGFDSHKSQAPYRGWYTVSIKIAALNRLSEHGDHWDKNEKLRLRVFKNNVGRIGNPHKSIRANRFDIHFKDFELEDGEQTVQFDIFLEKDCNIKLNFPNSLSEIELRKITDCNRNKLFADLTPAFLKTFDKESNKNYPDHWSEKYKYVGNGNPWPRGMQLERYSKYYPTLRVKEISFDGPFYKSWPTPAEKHLLGDKSLKDSDLRKVIARLATRAFRRPLVKGEINPILDFVEHTFKQTGSKREALAQGIRCILSSPQFFYLREDNSALSNIELASRLSYFLWSSMPDEELMETAMKGRLKKKAVLKQQVDRMLRDPKAEDFITKFADQAFQLWKLGTISVSAEEGDYHRFNIQQYNYQESILFFKYIFENNRNLMEILNADYRFINRPIAAFYNYKDYHKLPLDESFRKMPVLNDKRRGILAQPAFMTATANGIDTSPILRGLWVYETIYGKEPPPPPEDVPAIAPDIRNAKTLREQLELHRNDPACKNCHKKFDHFGFALENFDALGRWRSHYREGEVKLPVQANGVTEQGQSFEDIKELRELIVLNEELFTESLCKKLLNMATGREMNAFDSKKISEIARQNIAHGNGFLDLVREVALCQIMKTK